MSPHVADLFRSAVSFIHQHAAPLISHHGSSSHPMVGSTLDIGNTEVQLRSLIAEGGSGYVFFAEGPRGKLYALKMLIAADKSARNAAMREIKFNKDVSFSYFTRE